MNWKWSNVPIPEAHLFGLVIGTALQVLFSKNLFQTAWIGPIIGWPFIIAGIGLCIWAVIAARETNIANPNILLKNGPYALGRNPMYVGWAFISSGISLAANSFSIMALLPIVFIYIHFVDIRNEERSLAEQFGTEYRQYRQQVRRYF
jgi:protein-S-isoprenylcysteine O-methyltransferase Ste14